MSIWLLEGIISVVFTALALPLALVPIVNSVYRRYGQFAGWPAVLAFGSVAMACGLVAFTMFPLPNPAGLDCDLRSNLDYWSIEPLESFRDVRAVFGRDGAGALLSSTFLQVAFNVLLFVPIGFLIHQQTRWSAVRVVGLGFALSALVELTQGTAVFGLYDCPYRVAEFDDLLTNTAGAAIGLVISRMAFHWFDFTEPEQCADLDPPGLRRRVAAAALDLVAFLVIGAALAAVVVVAVALLGESGAVDGDTVDAIRWVLQRPIAAVIVGLVVPMVRPDGATVGQAAVDIHPQGGRQLAMVVKRFAVRWLPWIVLPGVTPLLAVVLELLVAQVRADGRSPTELVSGEVPVTTRFTAAGAPPSG
ncbi:MAG: VanZ family protein [Acidimicrobiales bacterium]|nr:VanZ family protein [Acidimicrobiales bacterium]